MKRHFPDPLYGRLYLLVRTLLTSKERFTDLLPTFSDFLYLKIGRLPRLQGYEPRN